MEVLRDEEESIEEETWKMYFDDVSNALGHGVGTVLISPSGKYYPFTTILNFDWTNVVEYEACILGLHMTIE